MSEKTWSVEFSRKARRALKRTETSVSARLLNHLDRLSSLENPLRHKDVRDLEGKLQDYHRLRVGEYRVIFELDSQDKKIKINAIVPRGQAY